MRRGPAVAATAAAMWVAGVGSVLSFNVLAAWHPLEHLPPFGGKTFFELADFVSGNVLLPVGALFTCLFVGWRVDPALFAAEIDGTNARLWPLCRFMLRYICPAAILAVLLAAFLPGRS
jgi:NSS family neurotransmitter:Na+ symporter